MFKKKKKAARRDLFIYFKLKEKAHDNTQRVLAACRASEGAGALGGI